MRTVDAKYSPKGADDSSWKGDQDRVPVSQGFVQTVAGGVSSTERRPIVVASVFETRELSG